MATTRRARRMARTVDDPVGQLAEHLAQVQERAGTVAADPSVASELRKVLRDDLEHLERAQAALARTSRITTAIGTLLDAIAAQQALKEGTRKGQQRTRAAEPAAAEGAAGGAPGG